MLEQAKERIAISSFSIKADRSSKEVISCILAAANRGVKVQILVDGLRGYIDMEDDPIYYALGSHPNVEIRYYNMFSFLCPWTGNGRMHDKYILIDNELLLLGGRNISNYFIGEYNTSVLSYDRDILVYNTAANTETGKASAITQVWDYFKTIWDCEYSKRVYDSIAKKDENQVATAYDSLEQLYQEIKTVRADLFEPIDYTSMTVPTNKITLISNPIHIMSKQPYVWFQLSELMKHATNRIYIQTPYSVLNKVMYQDLRKIRANVSDCKILLNARAVGDNFVASSDYTMNRKKIMETGLQIYEFQGDNSMHNKSILIDDDISVIGSYNLDMRSTYLDTEVMLVVHGKEFNQLLEGCIQAMENQSLPVLADGSYGENNNVKAVSLSTERKMLFGICSVVFQLFRYLI
jgi:phosphatidylserine/phosphatidylglycerophosphate/cardiolipin synthase-like enzyme